MKKIIGSVATLCFISVAANAADKIIIKGEPIILEKKGEVYVVPETYTLGTEYNYVTVDTEKQVCYLDKKPDLVSLNVKSISVEINGQAQIWNCYPVDPTYFVVE